METSNSFPTARWINFRFARPMARWVIYEDAVNGNQLMKVPIDGGKAEKISDQLAAAFDISPDSKTIAVAAFGHLGEHVEMLALISMDSNQTLKTLQFERPRTARSASRMTARASFTRSVTAESTTSGRNRSMARRENKSPISSLSTSTIFIGLLMEASWE